MDSPSAVSIGECLLAKYELYQRFSKGKTLIVTCTDTFINKIITGTHMYIQNKNWYIYSYKE